MKQGKSPERPWPRTGLSLALVAFSGAAQAFAQQAPAGDRPAHSAGSARTSVYGPEFFAPYAPSTALDIVTRVPGFVLETGSTDVRGFAGAAGNVVVNGARPSSKSETLDALLARIPARRVQKVEVGPGDLYGSDYSSKTQVLNIILAAEGGLDGSVKGKLTRLYDGRLVPDLEGNALWRRGKHSFSVAAGTGTNTTQEEGYDRVTVAGSGEPIEYRRKVNRYKQPAPFLAASWSFEPGGNRAAHVNLRAQPGKFDLLQTNHVVPVAGPERDDRLIEQYKVPAYELGGDVSQPLAGGTIKLVGLATRRRKTALDAYYNRIDERIVGGFEQNSRSRYDESLARLGWTRSNLAGMAVELGSEVALNKLTYGTSLAAFDEVGNRTIVELPLSNAVVKEVRTESFVNAGRQVSRAVRVDARLAYETSRLTVSGDAEARRSLGFLKPSLTLDLQPGGGWHAQLIARRTVAQLDFYDFVSSADLAAGRVNGGNADLEPQRAWEFRATADHKLLGDGQLRVEVGHDRISKVQDRILTEDGFDAPGNLGRGTRSFVDLTLDAPLGRWWKGLRGKANATFQRTRVDDPISGDPRRFSGFWPDWQWSLELRRDRGRWAYGGTLADRQGTTLFRTDMIERVWNVGPYATAFVEYRPDPLTTVRLDVDNLLDSKVHRLRNFYFPNRAVPLSGVDEFAQRNIHPSFTLSLRRSLGGGGVAKPAPAR
ncbi:hypothetical protein HMF7854_09745 [Sphingomonas ginkgonis]|uniref:Uncharacterized protein n=1 Tax=Sphingomonas ginkgonis TaxID=2315330 RepID=A0A3R9Z6M0_9SPHN|nr:TonB-dependent receptor [Sphingomonas ginkgonis]RST31088.1 hypothetical protein HMF7854_09745 [Sphingomonas ginkgonis]